MPRPCTCDDVKRCGLCWTYHNNPKTRARWDKPGPVVVRTGSLVVTQQPAKRMAVAKRGLGDAAERALSFVGITSNQVEKWLGTPCGCKERREKLNRLGAWASKALSGLWSKEEAAKELPVDGGVECKDQAMQQQQQRQQNLGAVATMPRRLLSAPTPVVPTPKPIDLATFFDRVVVINLKRRPERLKTFWEELERIKWPFRKPEVFEAVDGLGLPKPASWKHHDMAHACRQSHVAVLQQAICDKVKNLLVLEDDAIFDDDFTQKVMEFLSKVPSDWEGIMLGGMLMEKERVTAGVVRALNCQRTHCYAVRGKYLRSLYSTWLDCQMSIDWGEVVSPVQKKHRVYAPEVWLVDQAAGRSDISGNEEPRRRYFNEKKHKDAPKSNAPTSLGVFYHVACLNHWKAIVSEQLALLSKVALRDIKACVLGSKGDVEWMLEEAARHKVSLDILHTSEDLTEHETPTLAEAWSWASKTPLGATMYLHVKGVTAPPGHHEHGRKARWRDTMQKAVVVKWKQNLIELAAHDVVGTWWAGNQPGVFPHFSGNFWMARNDWLSRLQDPRLYRVSRNPNSNFAGQPWARMHAEAWIGSRPGHRIKSW